LFALRRKKIFFSKLLCYKSSDCIPTIFFVYSLSPTSQASITPLLEQSESHSNIISDENEQIRQLCNISSPRNTKKQDSSSPIASLLVEEVKKLEIHTSDPDISRLSKTSSPLASSSNLTKDTECVRFNNENNNRKWHCSVSDKCFGFCISSIRGNCFFFILFFHFLLFPSLTQNKQTKKTITCIGMYI
jgi:hypothetical protein